MTYDPINFDAVADRRAAAELSRGRYEWADLVAASLADIPDLIDEVLRLRGLLASLVSDRHVYPS